MLHHFVFLRYYEDDPQRELLLSIYSIDYL